MLPKVTVLMTIYNGEIYLKECMDSVLNQTFKDFEFLIVDDCSTDGSKAIIKSYKDNRIRLIENEKNLSQVRSLNIGLDEAAGEYIARMDQDDIMERHRLKKQVDFLNRRPDISVVGTWGQVIDENGRIFTSVRLPVRNEEIIGAVLSCAFFLMHPSAAFRKDAVINAGKYNEKIAFSEDYNLWSRLLLKRHKIENIPEYLIKFRYHKNSSSRQFSNTQMDNVRLSLADFIKVITGESRDSEIGGLCDILINAGLMNKKYWSEDLDDIELGKAAKFMDKILEKTIGYFDFGREETHRLKKVFCGRILNFLYEAPGRLKKKGLPLYLFCLRHYPCLFLKPKLYLYPLKSVI